MRVVWAPSALRQIERILDYLSEFNPQAAVTVAESLVAAGDSLALFPHRGRPVPDTDRRDLVAVPPYVIRYRIARGDEVRILRVRHAARRPTRP